MDINYKDCESSDEEIELVNNTKYIKILPTSWMISNTKPLNKHLCHTPHSRLNSEYLLSNSNNKTSSYLNKSIVIDIPNTFYVFDENNERDSIYWEFIYDKNNIEYDILGKNITKSNQVTQDILTIINNSGYYQENIILNTLYKVAKLYKHNTHIASSIHIDAQVYRIVMSHIVDDTEKYIEITFSETNCDNTYELVLLYIGHIETYDLTNKSSIVLDSDIYMTNINCKLNCHQEYPTNTLVTDIIKTKTIIENNIYTYPTLYSIIHIPNGYKIKKLKINIETTDNYNINIWEGFLDSSNPMKLHWSGCPNTWICINTFTGSDPCYNYPNRSNGNYLFIEIPYVNIKNLNILGGEIFIIENSFKYHMNPQIEILNTQKEFYKSINDVDFICPTDITNINIYKQGIPSIIEHPFMRFPILYNKYIISNCLTRISNIT